MASRFTFYRSAVPALARQRAVQAALADHAQEVAAEARGRLSSRAQVQVAPVVTHLADADRAGWRVQDVGPDAVRREFGNGRGPGKRVFGRLAGRRT